jgi:hypothetical protein
VTSCKVVGGADALGGILYRHMETAEGDHFCFVCDMEIVKRCFLEFGGGGGRGIADMTALES